MPIILSRFSLRRYLDVAAGTEIAGWEIIPSGEIWEIDEFRGNAGFDLNTTVKLIWDYEGTEEIVAATNGENVFPLDGIAFTGDGVKKLAVVLINDLPETVTLGAEIRGKKVAP